MAAREPWYITPGPPTCFKPSQDVFRRRRGGHLTRTFDTSLEKPSLPSTCIEPHSSQAFHPPPPDIARHHTCMMVLVVSMGIKNTRHTAAVAEAASVLTVTGRLRVLS